MRERGADFDEFVVAESTRLMRMAVALTGDRGAAEDLLQDVLERMYVAWPRIDEPSAYARRALVNATTNRWRWRSRRPEHPVGEVPDRPVPDGAEERGRRDVLLRAIATLPARQRAVVVLRFLEDLAESDTARVLGCSTGTVKSQTARALERLRGLVLDTDAASPSTGSKS